MDSGAIRIVLSLFLWTFCRAENGCGSGIPCVHLDRCPQLEGASVADAIKCGFLKEKPLYCCDSSTRGDILPTDCGKPSSHDTPILPGRLPTPVGVYPWIAALVYSEPHATSQIACSAAVINSRYLLTSAHCASRPNIGSKDLSAVYLGVWNVSSVLDCESSKGYLSSCLGSNIVTAPEDIVVHPDYNVLGRFHSDIALVRLDRAIDFSSPSVNVRPICLPPPEFAVRGSGDPIVASWGTTNDDHLSNVMIRSQFPFADDAVCKRKFKERFSTGQLCTVASGSSYSCTGDGPLFVRTSDRFTLVGISSFGSYPCGIPDFPEVFTSVPYYRDWILENLKP